MKTDTITEIFLIIPYLYLIIYPSSVLALCILLCQLIFIIFFSASIFLFDKKEILDTIKKLELNPDTKMKYSLYRFMLSLAIYESMKLAFLVNAIQFFSYIKIKAAKNTEN